jgi:hypothetical protein
MYEDDRTILITALEEAAKAYRALNPVPTILGAEPEEIVDAVSAAVGRCKTYQAVAGLVVFSGGSGPVLDAHSLASRLFSKGVRWGNDIPAAVEWLIRLMTTRETTGLFKAAIWGLGLNQEVTLTETSRLMPFTVGFDTEMHVGDDISFVRQTACAGAEMGQLVSKKAEVLIPARRPKNVLDRDGHSFDCLKVLEQISGGIFEPARRLSENGTEHFCRAINGRVYLLNCSFDSDRKLF